MEKSLKDNLAVIGLFHLGSVFSIGFASLGFKVLGFDPDKKIISNLKKNKVPLFEPGLEELLKKSKSEISFTTDFSNLSKYSTIFFTQDTETDGRGSTEKLQHLINLSLPFFKQDSTIVVLSQVPIGFNTKLFKTMKTKRPDLNFSLYHWVDTIIMTKALERFLTPERIIIGKSKTNEKINPGLRLILSKFSCPVFEMSYESAEITKAAINLYLASSVTFANTLSNFCENFGGNIYDIIPALKSDKRVGNFAYIYPGLRISGGHLERDLLMLKRIADKGNISSGIVSKIIDENESRYLWIEKKLKEISKKIEIKKIALWGLAYKKNSTSVENAPSIKIVSRLQKKYLISAYDPKAIIPRELKLKFIRTLDKYQTLKESDVMILLTDWDEFQKIDFKKVEKNLKNKIIIDALGYFRNKKQPKGFQIIRLGVNGDS